MHYVEKLSTLEELSYYILCSSNKYEHILPRLQMLEGSDYLLLRDEYCRNIYLVLNCFRNIYIKGYITTIINICRDYGVKHL